MMRDAGNDLERFRTRWQRWLGNKTRTDKPYWTTLLNSNWTGWASMVLESCAMENVLAYESNRTREGVKRIFTEAIRRATMKQLIKLDALYASEKLEPRNR